MKQIKLPSFIIGELLVLITFIGCQTPTVDQPCLPTNEQRVSATVKLYLTRTDNSIELDTIHLNGTVYTIDAVDSTSFRYDTQQRVVWYQLTQSSQIGGKKVIFKPTGHTYLYQQDYMQEDLLRFPLNAAQRRVLSYTKKGYGYVDIDSGRQYSSEGLLLSTLLVRLNPDYSGINNRLPTWRATYQAGNMVQLETYDYFTGDLAGVTHYFYDDQHRAPLATFTFLGETSYNALLRKTHTSYDRGRTYTTEYLYTNQYDGQGRLVGQLEHSESENLPYTEAYTLTKYYY